MIASFTEDCHKYQGYGSNPYGGYACRALLFTGDGSKKKPRVTDFDLGNKITLSPSSPLSGAMCH